MLLSVRIITPLFLILAGVQAKLNTDNCKLISASETQLKALNLLEPLTNQNFTTEGQEKEKYSYIFQVCGDAGGLKNAGLIQVKDGKQVKIGDYTKTRAVAESDWVLLIYEGGEKYDTHCSNEARKAMIMISCSTSSKNEFSVVLGENEKQEDCYYLFKLDTNAICRAVPSKLSAGSIFLIVLPCCLALCLTGGFLYQRLVVGAKRVEKFPNYAFWSGIGNLSADGCDFVCCSRGNREKPPATEPLGETPEEKNEHFLPM